MPNTHPTPSLSRHLRRVLFHEVRAPLMPLAVLGGLAFGFPFYSLFSRPFLGRDDTSHFFVVFGVSAGAAAVVVLARACWLIVVPWANPFVRRLSEHGRPWEVVTDVEAELADAGVVTFGRPPRAWRFTESVPPLYLTRSWLVQMTRRGVRLVYLDDVLWVWEQDPEHRSFRLTRERPVLRVLVRRGRHKEFEVPAGEADRLLLWLARRVPWVRIDYHPALERWWYAAPRDLAALARQVEEDWKCSRRFPANEPGAEATPEPHPEGIRQRPGFREGRPS